MQPFRFNSSGWLTGSLHFIIIAIAAQADTPAAWPYALAAMSGVSFCAWVANYRRYRTIHDLPTSKIASAAQGYVELFGRSELLPGTPIQSKLSSTRCCWYRYYLEHRTSDDKWEHEDSGTSTEHFVVIDDTGQCVVSPEGAEVLCAEKNTWTQGSYRYTEWLLLPQGKLYAIGDFVTLGGAQADVDERRDLSELLKEWKAQPAQLLARFDLNGDGELDLKEWELARLQARREIQKAHSEIRSRGGVHMLRRPGDGRLFLLACEVPDKIGRRYAWWSAVHLAVFFAAATAAFVLFSTGAAS